jgi:hypothetical protein
MIPSPELAPFSLEDFVAQQEKKNLLRFVACGSVDHGKSTLIGRLLYESKCLFDDQLDALAKDSQSHGTQDGKLDLALVLDGLAAEPEQKITIDVAYRFLRPNGASSSSQTRRVTNNIPATCRPERRPRISPCWWSVPRAD